MEMGEHYGLPDLRQLMGGRTLFPAVSQAAHADHLSGNGDLSNRQHFEMMMMMGGHQVAGEGVLPLGVVDFHHPDHHSTSTSTAADAAPSTSEKETCINGGDGGNGRWPRQETLTLLEIRSLLDPKFKEANQKGPLWDEVSRIMAEEHGYQRSGKKCREKFENLYKYYKKTKESKAGRQDGKHYRFFRQLEALYGDTEKETNSTPPPPPVTAASETFRFQPTSNDSNPQQANQLVQEASQSQQKHCESLSLSNSSDFDTSSSDDSVEKKKLKMQDNVNQSQKRGRRSWKVKIRDFVDLQMRKLVEKQEAWLEKMLKTLESKEKERISREEAWRKEETARLDREYKFWAHERAWVEARDAALMDALHKFTAREPKALSPEDENGSETLNDCSANNNNCGSGWEEHEISCLIKLKSNMESSFQETGGSNAMLWEEVSSKMACLGYNRSAKSCNDKWESINISNNMGSRSSMEYCNNLKGLKQTSRTRASFHNILHLPFRQGTQEEQVPETSPSPSNSNSRTAVHDSCFRYLMAEEEPLWQNYDVKLNKGDDNS